MKSRSAFIKDRIQPPPTLTRDDWWKPIKISNAVEHYPDYTKISIDQRNPLTHNTFYTKFINNEELNNFYLNYNLENKNNEFIEISDDFKNQVINFMTHIHAEYTIKFKNIYFTKYSINNKKIFIDDNNKKNKIVSFMIILKNSKLKCLIDNKEFDLTKNGAITMSPTHQNFKVLGLNENSENVELLFFNFLLEKEN
jgi:hypothetical protein